jgi:hypothetical protein
MSWFCRLALIGIFWNFVGHAAAEETPHSVPLHRTATARFAGLEEGREAITRRDTFTGALSKFDLESRLKTNEPVEVADLLKLYADNVTEWPPEDRAKVQAALEFVRERSAGLDLKLPETVWMVRTTGKEEANAAYCRGPAIVLPEPLIRQREAGLQRLVAHELFHVLSTHDAELRRDLYKLIGFTLCDPIELPASLRDRKITNPDAPRMDCTITLELADDERVVATPVLLAKGERYDATSGKSLFDYLDFKLLVVSEQDGRFRAALDDAGEPRLLDPRAVASYAEQIGKNTGYIIHPDEILADNFAHLIMQTDRLPTPEIVERMEARLRAGKAESTTQAQANSEKQ